MVVITANLDTFVILQADMSHNSVIVPITCFNIFQGKCVEPSIITAIISILKNPTVCIELHSSIIVAIRIIFRIYLQSRIAFILRDCPSFELNVLEIIRAFIIPFIAHIIDYAFAWSEIRTIDLCYCCGTLFSAVNHVNCTVCRYYRICRQTQHQIAVDACATIMRETEYDFVVFFAIFIKAPCFTFSNVLNLVFSPIRQILNRNLHPND